MILPALARRCQKIFYFIAPLDTCHKTSYFQRKIFFMSYIHVHTCIFTMNKKKYALNNKVCIDRVITACFSSRSRGFYFPEQFSYSVICNVQNKANPTPPLELSKQVVSGKQNSGVYTCFYFFFSNSCAQHYVCKRLRTYVVTHEGVQGVFSPRNATL